MRNTFYPERVASVVSSTVANPTHTEQRADVVFHATNDDGLALEVLENASEIVLEFLPQRSVAQQGAAVFGGEGRTRANPGQRLRHDGQNGTIGVRMQPIQGWENVGA
jgi:hypothetical protein